MIFHSFDVTVDFEEDEAFGCSLDQGEAFDVDLGYTAPQNEYEGAYEVTPTQQMQTLLTKDKLLSANIVINPIPSNYGLITWDGATLTVS